MDDLKTRFIVEEALRFTRGRRVKMFLERAAKPDATEEEKEAFGREFAQLQLETRTAALIARCVVHEAMRLDKEITAAEVMASLAPDDPDRRSQDESERDAWLEYQEMYGENGGGGGPH